MKKNLAMRLRERTETIEYRAIVTKLNAIAQNKSLKQQYLAMTLQPETIIQLQNEGVTVEKITEFGYQKYRLTWAETKEQKLSAQIKWKVDFSERHISVPHGELTEAQENAFVSELRGLGFHIQSAIA